MNNTNEWTSEHTLILIIYLVCLFSCVKITKFIIKKRDSKWCNEVEGRLVSSIYCTRDPLYEESSLNTNHYEAKYELIVDGKSTINTYHFDFGTPPEYLKFYYYKSPKDAISEGRKKRRHQLFKFFMYVVMPFILMRIVYYGFIWNK